MISRFDAFRAYEDLKRLSEVQSDEALINWRSEGQEFCRKVEKGLLPFAEQGDAHFQFALAESLALAVTLQPDMDSGQYEAAMARISSWWEKAARQGHAGAVEYLVSLGTGEEAVRLQMLAEDLARDVPVDEDSMTRLTLRAYGVLLPLLDFDAKRLG
jgi:hypothetical protein